MADPISLFDEKSGKVYDAPDEATAQAQMRAYGLTAATPDQIAAHDAQLRSGGTLDQLRTVPETALATAAESFAGAGEAAARGIQAATGFGSAPGLERESAVTRGADLAPAFAYTPGAIERRQVNPNAAAIGATIPDVASTLLIPEAEGAGLLAKGASLLGRSAVAGVVAEGGATAIEGDDYDLGDAAMYGLAAGALEVGGHYAFSKAMKAAGATKDALGGVVDKARRWAVTDAVGEPDKALRGLKMAGDDVAEKLYEKHQVSLDEALGVIDQRMADAPEKLFNPGTLKKTVSDNFAAQSDHFLEVAVQLQHAAEVSGSAEVAAARNIMQDALESNGPQMYRAVRDAREILETADLAGSELGTQAMAALDDSLRNEGVWGKAAKNYAHVADPAINAGPKSVGARANKGFRVDDLDARAKLGERLDSAQAVASATGDKKTLNAIKQARKAMAGADDVTGARVMGADAPADEWVNTPNGRGARERVPGKAATGGLWNKAKNYANQIGEEEVGGLVEGGFKKAGMAVGGAVGGLPGMALGYLGGRALNRAYGPQASQFAWRALKKGAAGAVKKAPLRAAGAAVGAVAGAPYGGAAAMAGAFAGQRAAKKAGQVVGNAARKAEGQSKRIWNAVKEAAEKRAPSAAEEAARSGSVGAARADAFPKYWDEAAWEAHDAVAEHVTQALDALTSLPKKAGAAINDAAEQLHWEMFNRAKPVAGKAAGAAEQAAPDQSEFLREAFEPMRGTNAHFQHIEDQTRGMSASEKYDWLMKERDRTIKAAERGDKEHRASLAQAEEIFAADKERLLGKPQKTVSDVLETVADSVAGGDVPASTVQDVLSQIEQGLPEDLRASLPPAAAGAPTPETMAARFRDLAARLKSYFVKNPTQGIGAGLAAAGAGDAYFNPDDQSGTGTAAASAGLLAMFLPTIGRRALGRELDESLSKLAFRERTALSQATRKALAENEELLRKFAKKELGEMTGDEVLLQQGKNVLAHFEDLVGHGEPLSVHDMPPELYDAISNTIDFHNSAIIENDAELLRLARVGHFDALPGGGQRSMPFAERPRDLERFGLRGPADTAITEAAERPLEITGSHSPRGFREQTHARFNAASEAMPDDMPQSAHNMLESVSRQTIADLPRTATEGQVRGAAAVAFDGWKQNVEHFMGRRLTAQEAEYAESAILFDVSEHAHVQAGVRDTAARHATELQAMQPGGTGYAGPEAEAFGDLGRQSRARWTTAEHSLRPGDMPDRASTIWQENMDRVREHIAASPRLSPAQIERAAKNAARDFEQRYFEAYSRSPNARELEYVNSSLYGYGLRQAGEAHAAGQAGQPGSLLDQLMQGARGEAPMPHGTGYAARQENALASSAPGSTRRVLDDAGAQLRERDFTTGKPELDATREALVGDIGRDMDHATVISRVRDAVESWERRLQLSDLPAPNERERQFAEASLMNAAAEQRFNMAPEAAARPGPGARGGDAFADTRTTRRRNTGHGERVMEDLDEDHQRVWRENIDAVTKDAEEEGTDLSVDEIVDHLREQHIMDPEDEIFVRMELGEDEYPLSWRDTDSAIDGAVRTLAGYASDGDEAIDADDIIRMINNGETPMGNHTLTPMEERQIRGRIDQDSLDRDFAEHFEEMNPPPSSEPPSSDSGGGEYHDPGGREHGVDDGLPPDVDLERIGIANVDMRDRAGIENVFGDELTLRDMREMFALDHFRTYAEASGQELTTKLIVKNNEINFEGAVGRLQLDAYYTPSPGGGVKVNYRFASVPKDVQGQGLFRAMTKDMIQGMERRGATEVKTESAIDIGRYAWPAVGMRPSPEAEAQAQKAFIGMLDKLGVPEEVAGKMEAHLMEHPELMHIADATVPLSSVEHILPQLEQQYRSVAGVGGGLTGDVDFKKAFIAGDQFRAGKAFLLSQPGPWNSNLKIKIDRNDPWYRQCLKRLGLVGAAGLTGYEALKALDGHPLTFSNGEQQAAPVDPAELAEAHEQAAADQQKSQTRAQLDYLKAQSQNAVAVAARALASPEKNTRTVPRAPGVSNSAGVQAFMGTQSTMRAAFDDKKAALAKLQQDPMVLIDEMADSFGALQNAAPDLHRKVVAQTYKVASFLADKMPGTIGASLTRPEGTPVSALNVRQFALYYSAATEPSTVLTDLTHNRAQKEQVDTLRELWPDTYAKLKQGVIDEMSMARPTYAQRARLDLLFDLGESLDTALSGRLVATLDAYKQTPKGQGKTEQDGKQAAPPAMPTRKSNPSIVATGALGSLSQGATSIAA